MKLKNRKENRTLKAGRPNGTLLTFALAMIIFGTIMIFDASVYLADQEPFNDKYHFLKLHIAWLILGMIPASIAYFWDYRKYVKLAVPGLIVVILMLIAVLFSSEAANGSKRWLSLGHERIVVQPAEFAKVIFILYISSWLAKERKTYKTFRDAFKYGFGQKLIGFSAGLGLILLLIILEPDLGTTLILGVTAFIIFFVSGTDIAHLFGTMLLSIVFTLLAAIAAIIEPYRLSRVKTFLKLTFTGEVDDPTGAGYQVYQILLGIGSAGFWGKGFGQSRQRFGYLVENTAFTDSIFAVILEELGMLGGIILILAWVLFLSEGFKVASKAPDTQGKYIAIGITVWLTLQAFLNMAANVALIPLTGIPLPFITYGGSSTIVAMIGIAILLNISRFSDNGTRAKTVK